MKNLILVVLSLLLLLTSGSSYFFWRLSQLQAPQPTGDYRPELADLESAAAWNALVETLRVAGEEALREGPNGPLSEQDAVERFNGLLAILSNTTRLPFNADPARPLITVFDLQPPLTKIGGNSPDADYHGFPVSPDYSYRLRGSRSKAPFFNIQIQSMRLDLATMRPQVSLVSSLAGHDIRYDDAGRFEILIGLERPSGYEGQFLPMDENSFTVAIREYHHDAEAEGDPDLEVEVIGDVPMPVAMTDGEVAARIQRATFMSRFWFDARHWLPNVLEPEAINTFPSADLGAEENDDLGLNTDVRYKVGAWRLGPEEALVVEGQFPVDTPYWIFQIADRWHETADFRHRQVHLNNATARLGPDGRFRIVVSERRPSGIDWVDTGGREEGFMSFRWVPTSDAFSVTTRVVAFADLAED